MIQSQTTNQCNPKCFSQVKTLILPPQLRQASSSTRDTLPKSTQTKTKKGAKKQHEKNTTRIQRHYLLYQDKAGATLKTEREYTKSDPQVQAKST
jgi:hypothetical protein